MIDLTKMHYDPMLWYSRKLGVMYTNLEIKICNLNVCFKNDFVVKWTH
jgi:hypothetical protein